MSSSKSSSETGLLTEKIVGILRKGIPSDSLGVVISEQEENVFQILTDDGILLSKHVLELYVPDLKAAEEDDDEDGPRRTSEQQNTARPTKIRLGKNNLTFQWRRNDAQYTEPLPLTQVNVQKACVEMAREEMVTYMLNFEKNLSRTIDTMMQSAILQTLGFERDTWSNAPAGLKLSQKGMLGDMLRERLQHKFNQYIDQHFNPDELLRVLHPLIDKKIQNLLESMVKQDSSYRVETTARKIVNNKMQELVDKKLSDLLNQSSEQEDEP